MIKQTIASELFMDISQVQDDARLMDLPEIDSLTFSEIMMALEDQGYTVPNESEIPKDATVRDFIKIVESEQ